MKALLAVLLLAAAVVAENQCPSAQETNWEIEELLRHEECDKFYKCTYGVPVEQECYGGLYFNLDTWQCDWPANVDCTGRIDPEEKSAEAPLEPEEAEEPKQESEEEEAPQEPEEESEQAPEEPEKTEEESDEAPEESEQAPEEPEQAPEEPAKESDENCDESEEQQTELEFQENGCPVDPHVHWLLPHEEDCNQFYYCVWGQKELRNCPSSLHFNRRLQVCDWPTDAACPVSANKHYRGRAVAFRNL